MKSGKKSKAFIRALALITAVLMCLALTACKGENASSGGNSTGENTSSGESQSGTSGSDNPAVIPSSFKDEPTVNIKEDVSKTVDNNEKLSANGGNYTLSGNKLTITVSGNVDFSQVKHFNRQGYVFLGWKHGSSYAKSGSFTSGTVLTADYAKFSASEFGVTGVAVKANTPKGLNFTVTRKDSFTKKIGGEGAVKEYGSLLLKTDDTYGKSMRLGCGLKAGEGSVNIPVAVKGNATAKTAGGAVTYTRTVYNIKGVMFRDFYTVTPYVVYTDKNGAEQVAYGVYKSACMYVTAASAIKSGKGNDYCKTVVNYAENGLVADYLKANYNNRTLLAGYSSTDDKDPNHAMYRLTNGLIVREVNIDWKYSGSAGDDKDPLELVQVSDTHFNYCNDEDFFEANPAVMSTYQYRAWNKDGASAVNSSRAVEYASLFDGVIYTGDTMDYLSNGCFEMCKKLLFDKNMWLKGKAMFAVTGNHEYMREMQGKVADTKTTAECYNDVAKFWPNNVRYASGIITNKAGKNAAMVLALDTGTGQYVFTDKQISQMKSDLATARKKNIPVLIFQHEPLCTKNKASAVAKYIYRTGDSSGASINLYNTGVGSSAATQCTQTVYKLITDNADIVAGVFCGHEHNNMYCEVKGTDAKATPIPQYILSGTPYDKGCVIKISIK